MNVNTKLTVFFHFLPQCAWLQEVPYQFGFSPEVKCKIISEVHYKLMDGSMKIRMDGDLKNINTQPTLKEMWQIQ